MWRHLLYYRRLPASLNDHGLRGKPSAFRHQLSNLLLQPSRLFASARKKQAAQGTLRLPAFWLAFFRAAKKAPCFAWAKRKPPKSGIVLLGQNACRPKPFRNLRGTCKSANRFAVHFSRKAKSRQQRKLSAVVVHKTENALHSYRKRSKKFRVYGAAVLAPAHCERA